MSQEFDPTYGAREYRFKQGGRSWLGLLDSTGELITATALDGGVIPNRKSKKAEPTTITVNPNLSTLEIPEQVQGEVLFEAINDLPDRTAGDLIGE